MCLSFNLRLGVLN